MIWTRWPPSVPPLVDCDGDVFVGDSNQLWVLHSDGTLKWVAELPDADPPLLSAVMTLKGFVGGVTAGGKVVFFHREDGALALPILELPVGDDPPGGSVAAKRTCLPGISQRNSGFGDLRSGKRSLGGNLHQKDPLTTRRCPRCSDPWRIRSHTLNNMNHQASQEFYNTWTFTFKGVIVSLITAALCCCSSGGGSSSTQPIDESQRTVKSITTIKEYGKSVDWSHANNRIAFGKLDLDDSYYDIWVMNPDGAEETCLTANKPGFAKHNGNPSWHPSGDFIIFTAEIESAPDYADDLAVPGTGLNCNLWLMDVAANQFYQLTFYALALTEPVRAVIHPQFSSDGAKVFWAERAGGAPNGDIDDTYVWGEWQLVVADIMGIEPGDGGPPRLENAMVYQPGEQKRFYESHMFSEFEGFLLFCGNLATGQPVYGMDIYEFSPQISQITRLTDSFADWDEHAHYSPDGEKIVWISSTGNDIDWGPLENHQWQDYLITELWIMNADGSRPQKLTHFNNPGYPEFIGSRAVAADNAWSPEGDRVILTVAYEHNFGQVRSKMVMIKLNR